MASSFDRAFNGGNSFPSNTSFARTGIGMPSLTPELSTSDGLLQLAMSQGGAVSQAATEIAHPNTGILSTVSAGIKNAFGGFMDIISTPSRVVAGIISPTLTIGEAMQKKITPSDVIFGEKDPNATLYQKTGSFLARTAVDILTDPLTYITFGAGSGFMGLKAGSKIALGKNALDAIGRKPLLDAAGTVIRNADDVATLNTAGQRLYSLLTKTAKQMDGDIAASILKTGDTTLDLATDELQKVLKASIDSPLRPDFAKKALSNLLEKAPQLTADLLDKGGVKVLGKSILSGQRISSTLSLIPGMSKLDMITYQPRLAVGALFNPAIVKDGTGKYTRLPQEYVDMVQQWTDFSKAFGERKIAHLDDIVKQFTLSKEEARYLTAAIEYKRIPADPRLAEAFKATMGFNNQEWDDLVKSGMLSNVARLDAHVPHILVKNSVGPTGFKLPPSTKTGATELRQIAKFTDQATGQVIEGHAGSMGLKLVTEGDNKGMFMNATGDLFKRETAPLQKVKGSVDEALSQLEDTLLKDPKNAAKMLDDMRADGFEIFDDNAITALAARSLKNTKSISMTYFLRDLAQNFGHDAVLAEAQGFKRIASSGLAKAADEVIPIMSKDSELLFHPAIASHVEKFMGSVINDDATMDFLKAYDSLQNAWKSTVTSIWPAFHGRNAISNVFNNFLDLGLNALNPKIHSLSTSMIAADRKLAKLDKLSLGTGAAAKAAQMERTGLLQRVAFSDNTGYQWTFGELRQVAKNNNIAFTSRIVTSADVQKGPEQIARAFFPAEGVMEKAGRAVKKPFEIGQDVVGRAIEEQSRMVNFIANLRATGDVQLAAQRTKQFLFDYNNLTNFERTFLRRLIPFYTFTRKNFELQARAILTTPGKVAAQVHAIGTLGEVISGGQQLTDEERAALPDWVKAGTSILTKKNGDQINLISNLGTPLEAVFQQIQANVFLGSVSPLVRIPLEQMSGYSFFQGKPLSEVTNASAFKRAPALIKDLIGYTEFSVPRSDGTTFVRSVALHPEMMNFILNLPPTTRVFSALKQMDAVDVSEQAKILQQFTGLKPYSFDLVQERAKREKEMVEKLEKLLTSAGITANFTTTYIPKDKKAEILRNYSGTF